MSSSNDLIANFDFDHGKLFQEEVRSSLGKSVHHPSSRPDGSFFLLTTLRRYTFRLTEDSVALAWQSCLGGSAAGFHVSFQSDRHFRFSVSCKAVGFKVFNLKRFIGRRFDVYFHLWSNGDPHWEREKLKWELEQQREWTYVQSRKRKSQSSHARRVRFAPKLIQDSPISKHSPSPMTSFKVGSFCLPILDDQVPVTRVFGRIKSSLQPSESVLSRDPTSQACSSVPNDSIFKSSNA